MPISEDGDGAPGFLHDTAVAVVTSGRVCANAGRPGCPSECARATCLGHGAASWVTGGRDSARARSKARLDRCIPGNVALR